MTRNALGILLVAGAALAACYGAILLTSMAMTVPVRLVADAFEYEYQNNIHNSPMGGYRERLAKRDALR